MFFDFPICRILTNQSFSRVACEAYRHGSVVILQNNRPKYNLIAIVQDAEIEMTDDEKIDFVAARILEKYRKAFKKLAE